MTDQPNRLPDVRPTTIRLDDALRVAVDAEARRRGVSTSDYIRQATVAQLAWDYATRVAEAGGDLEAMADPSVVAAMLNEYARKHGKG